MIIKSSLLGLLISCLIIASCGPVAHVEQDPGVNLNNYKTYAWVETRNNENDNEERKTNFASLSVQNAVNEQMKLKGFTLTESNADLLLSYDLLVERDREERSRPVYNRPLVRYFYNPYFRRWSTLYYPSRFSGYDTYTVPVKEATLTISMMDANTDKTIWQGWATQNVSSGNPSPDEIRNKVEAIFNKFKR